MFHDNVNSIDSSRDNAENIHENTVENQNVARPETHDAPHEEQANETHNHKKDNLLPENTPISVFSSQYDGKKVIEEDSSTSSPSDPVDYWTKGKWRDYLPQGKVWER